MTDLLDRSWNPLVRLGLAFKKVHQLLPASEPNVIGAATNPESKSKPPLVDIEDVRKFLRKKLAIKEPVSTIPGLVEALSSSSSSAAASSSSIPRLDPLIRAEGSNFGASGSERFSSSSPRSVTSEPERSAVSSGHGYSSMPGAHPSHEAASGVHPFEIGTVGHPILELDECKRPPPAALDRCGEQNVVEYSWFVTPTQGDTTRARLEMEEVQEFIRRTGETLQRFRRWGLPETSWKNKMPWHDPAPHFLAKGLQWPQSNFTSREEKRLMYRRARKRRRFLLGSPPTWTFMLANVALIVVLVYNPAAKYPPA